VIALALLLTALIPVRSEAQLHCSQLPPLTPEAVFPRCTELELAAAGFPDHRHAHQWYGWQPPTDAAGQAYGTGTLCQKKVFIGAADLVLLTGEKRYRQVVMKHAAGYADCDMLGFVELVDWAQREVPRLLGLATSDTLTVVNPDNTSHYAELTGQGVWRLYQLAGNRVIIEPFPVLLARTLEGHAAFMLVTDWLLQRALPSPLPPWLQQGLVEYIGEDGPHLVNYMAQFRIAGPVLFSPPLVDAILAKGVDPDEGTDREMFRRACYSAYLMVWQLVESEGGLDALQDFLARAAAGADLDEAAVAVYGLDLTGLADLLDATRNGEPGGGKPSRQAPHVQP
jgi:hypothetical protein